MSNSATSDTPGLITRPPYFLLLALALAAALDLAADLSFLAASGLASLQSWIGLAFVLGAIALAVSGVRTFRRASTNVDPFQPALTLVTDGPYRFTRNPMYLGMVLFLLGVSLMFSLEWGLLLTPALWLAYDRLVVAREEAYLSRKFGEPYRAFLGGTRRWI
ncbi:MAG TPA: isoprenylcysteine carboxylmethyltransferase family protein [Devosiaceae bacterium]|jgi:protein-S-isoprenylcysteine O-methyltransferase Ste14|nr:isoprenylcysteine carboxylmethyltransferase family protein [Devosiaceae bacterium]